MLLFGGATMKGNGFNTRSMSKFRTNADTPLLSLASTRVSLACCYIFYTLYPAAKATYGDCYKGSTLFRVSGFPRRTTHQYSPHSSFVRLHLSSLRCQALHRAYHCQSIPYRLTRFRFERGKMGSIEARLVRCLFLVFLGWRRLSYVPNLTLDSVSVTWGS